MKKNKNKVKLALAMIVKGDDREADLLTRCLRNISSDVDGVFITITHKKGEELNKKTKDIAELYGAKVSSFEWVNDFSKARNFNFSQVPKEYTHIFWVDADDMVRGIENLKGVVEENPSVDCFSLMYLYEFDEHKNPIVVHQKTRVVKNDGCVTWAGALHEDFSENRSLIRHFVEDIEVLHLHDLDRQQEKRDRNVEVSQQMMEDRPDDPRSYWNLGNSLKGAGRNKEAGEILEEFLKRSNSNDEKYLARLRLAELNLIENNYPEALDNASFAIGMKPEYPDAYHFKAYIYFQMKQFEETIKSHLSGLIKKPPYYSIIVYNPRDYDYAPLMSMAKAYFNIRQPMQALDCLEACKKIVPNDKSLDNIIKLMKKETKKFERTIRKVKELKSINNKKKLKEELEKLDPEMQMHPAIQLIRNVHFIKKKSSGKDLAIYCGLTEEEWNPDTAKTKGIGGSEEAIIHLSKGLQAKGWKVTVYANMGHKEKVWDGVTWKPYWAWNYRDKQDALILWRTPKACDYDINCDNIVIDLHDVVSPGEFTPKRLEKITKIFVKTNFHKTLFPDIPDEKFIVIPNGIDSKIFEQKLKRDKFLMINTSSPDRSIEGCLDLFKEVKKEVPEAKMKWAYGWGVFDLVHGEDAKVMKWKKNMVKKMDELEGFENLGRVSHSEVAKLYLQSNVFLYPTEFAEIHCISAAKAQAGGSIPMTSDFAALNETVQFGTKVKSDKTKDNWVQDYQYNFSIADEDKKRQLVKDTIEKLKNPPSEEEREEMRKWARDTYSWDKIVDDWNNGLKS